jgi:hypothetical protein
MSEAIQAEPSSIDGFMIGQRVWFIRNGLVVSGVVTGFRPWLTNTSKFKAELNIADDLTASICTDDLFGGEVPATEWLLADVVGHAQYLRRRLKELAKKTTKAMERRAQ